MASATRTLLILVLAGLARGPQAQVIRLRHPEASGQLSAGQLAGKTSRPQQAAAPDGRSSSSGGGGGGGQQEAKPGNLIVHFDAAHEIQRVQYKLKDGSLATIFARDDKLRPAAKSAAGLELEPDQADSTKSEASEILGHVAQDALRPHLDLETAKSVAKKVGAKLAKVPGLLQAKSAPGDTSDWTEAAMTKV